MTLADRLVAYRKARELTQDDVAGMLDTTQQTVANWESGTMPRPMALAGLLAMLGDDPSSLCMPSPGSARSAIQEAFLSKVRELVDAGKLDDGACVDLLASWKQLF